MKNDERGIIRVHKSRDFSVINNTGLRDARLSFGARGILAYLLSKPDAWNLSVEDLIRQSPAGEHAVRQMLRELKRFGYLKRERMTGKNGRFEWQTAIYEVPQKVDGEEPPPSKKPRPKVAPSSAIGASPSGDFPQMEKPHMEIPDVEKPSVENRPIYEGLREEELREEILSEGVREGARARECEDASCDETSSLNAPTRPRFESKTVLDPDPRESPDLMALKEECNVSLIRPSAKDAQFWPDAVATVRDSLPDASPEERARAVREFKARWSDGGRRGNLYLSQVVTHWARVMNDSLRGDKTLPEQSATDGAERVRRAREAAYSAGRTP